LFLDNRIKYKNKIQRILAKNNKKNKKNKKTKYPYYLQENPRYNLFIYFETNIKKQKKTKINKKKIGVEKNNKILQNQNQRNLRKNKTLILIQVIIINVLL
jgi:hypothetical protein